MSINYKVIGTIKRVIRNKDFKFTIENENKYSIEENDEKIEYGILIQNGDISIVKDGNNAMLYKNDIFIDCDNEKSNMVLEAKARGWKVSLNMRKEKDKYILEEIEVK